MEKRPTMAFDPDDKNNVRHFKHGVWDFYEDISDKKRILQLPFLSRFKVLAKAYTDLPHVTRMLKDILSIEGVPFYFFLFIVFKFILAFMPAISLWYSGQLLVMVEMAVEKRHVDREALFRIAAGSVLAPSVDRLLVRGVSYTQDWMGKRIERYYTLRAFQTTARLDVPTFGERDTSNALWNLSYEGYSSMTWSVFAHLLDIFSSGVNLSSQVAVMLAVFRGHQEVKLISISIVAKVLLNALGGVRYVPYLRNRGVYALKTTNEAYERSEGLRKAVSSVSYRKEIVAEGLGDYLVKEYQGCQDAIGDQKTDQYSVIYGRQNTWFRTFIEYLHDPVDALAQIYTCLRVVDAPASVPFSLATLHLVDSTMSSLTYKFSSLMDEIDGIAKSINNVRQLYYLLDVPNLIVSGTVPFPENAMDVKQGISIEFRNVSFSYSNKGSYGSPSTKRTFALKNVSFKIEQGQLCVIVGENGSGKSTILTLINRIYDVTEGEILLNGHDIRTLKLEDVRRAIAVLFQDFTALPLSLGENIGLGDPRHSKNAELIEQAAKLGGAHELIEELPYKYKTYLERPVYDSSSNTPTNGSVFYGKKIDFAKLKLNDNSSNLSGGQKQRVALSRTFMKSIVSPDSAVGLLLFDEPSAALDPKAEHDLFTRLRELRGNKTMIFSSHRFGKLTRHADLILYIHKGQVIEAGNHIELMKKENGEYAKFWNLQAQDFL